MKEVGEESRCTLVSDGPGTHRPGGLLVHLPLRVGRGSPAAAADADVQ